MQLRHPLAADDTDEKSRPLLPRLVGSLAPGAWEIVVIDDRLVEGMNTDDDPVYPLCPPRSRGDPLEVGSTRFLRACPLSPRRWLRS